MTRKELLDILLKASPLYFSSVDFEKHMEGFEIEAMHLPCGQPRLIFIIKGPEFHFVKPTDQSIHASDLLRYPGSLIKKYGYATTKTPLPDKRQQRFNERLGFYRVLEDEEHIHYRIEKMRNRSCH
jgi:hypothetical protein